VNSAMMSPAPEELAAIAAAYVAYARASDVRSRPRASESSRWSLAGRIAVADTASARLIACSTSRWNIAGRLDG